MSVTSSTTQPDARILRTQRRLTDALVTLTLERGFEALTVRELTVRAGVGYATFFRHFASKEALLERLLEDTLDDLLGQLGSDAAARDPLRTATLVFRHAQRHADRYRVLLRSGDAADLLGRCLRLSADELSETFVPKPGGVVPFEVAVHHLVHSFVGLVGWYLDAGLPYPPERMGEILEQLILEPTYRVALEAKEG